MWVGNVATPRWRWRKGSCPLRELDGVTRLSTAARQLSGGARDQHVFRGIDEDLDHSGRLVRPPGPAVLPFAGILLCHGSVSCRLRTLGGTAREWAGCRR